MAEAGVLQMMEVSLCEGVPAQEEWKNALFSRSEQKNKSMNIGKVPLDPAKGPSSPASGISWRPTRCFQRTQNMPLIYSTHNFIRLNHVPLGHLLLTEEQQSW